MTPLESPLVAAIALVPGLARRLVTDHVDDGSGRCRLCPVGGQSGHQRWPCRIFTAAYGATGVFEPGAEDDREPP